MSFSDAIIISEICLRPAVGGRNTNPGVKEIIAWKDAEFSNSIEFLERYRDMYLLLIYTGYYYEDLDTFFKDQLLDDKEYGLIILGERDKNGNQTIIPLFKFPYAATILKKYKSGEEDKTVIRNYGEL